MVATVLIREFPSTAAPIDKTSGRVRFRSNNSASTDNANRLTIPAANQIYSFAKWLRLRITVAPDIDIDNLQGYTDGSNDLTTSSGVKVWSWVRSGALTFLAPTAPATGFDPPHYPATTTTTGKRIWQFVVGARVNLDAGDTGPFTATGDIGDFWIIAAEVESTAGQGQTATETITFSYDET